MKGTGRFDLLLYYAGTSSRTMSGRRLGCLDDSFIGILPYVSGGVRVAFLEKDFLSLRGSFSKLRRGVRWASRDYRVRLSDSFLVMQVLFFVGTAPYG